MANTVVINVQANTAAATADLTATTVAVDNLTKAEKKLNKETGQTASQFEEVTKNGGAIAILDQLTGGLASRVRDTFEATKLFNFSLKGMRTALIATGVGAFVVALGVVVAYWDEITDFISGASKKLQEYIDKQNQLLKDVRTELTILQKQKELADLRGDSIDEINKKIEQSLLLEKQETLALLNTLETQLKIEKSKEEELSTMDKLALKAVEIFGINQSTFQLLSLASQDETNFQEKLDEINALRLKVSGLDVEIQTLTNETANRTRKTVTGVNELTTEGIVAVEDTILQSNELTADSFVVKKRLTKDDLNNFKAVEQAKLGIASNTLNLIGSLAGEGSKLGKAIALGQATISGYEGVQNAFTTAQESPITLLNPAYPFIQAGLAGAFAATNIAKIVSAKPVVTGSSSGLSSVSSAPAQSPAFNIVGQGGTNQIASALGEQQQTPIQAFVVSQDVTTAQSLENGIIQGATLGD